MPAGRGRRGDRSGRGDAGGGGRRTAVGVFRPRALRRSGEPSAAGGPGGVRRPGDTEVDDPRPVRAQQEAARLRVPVDDVRGVHGPERRRRAPHEVRRGRHGQRSVPGGRPVGRQAGQEGGGRPRRGAGRVAVDDRREVVPPHGACGAPPPRSAGGTPAPGRLAADHPEGDGLVAAGEGGGAAPVPPSPVPAGSRCPEASDAPPPPPAPLTAARPDRPGPGTENRALLHAREIRCRAGGISSVGISFR